MYCIVIRRNKSSNFRVFLYTFFRAYAQEREKLASGEKEGAEAYNALPLRRRWFLKIVCLMSPAPTSSITRE